MTELRLGELLTGARLFLLELAPEMSLLLYGLPRAFGVRPELFGDRGQPGFVVGADARANVPGRRVRRVVQAGEPGFILSPLLQQTLDDGGALGRSLRHPTPLAFARGAPRGARPHPASTH